MTTHQEILEEALMIEGDEPIETINVELEKTETPKPPWFVHQVMKYLLPALKD
jgi:hypothetical protein